MSSATDLSAAIAAAQSSATVLINEAAADKQALAGALSDLNLARQSIAERDATIVQLRARIDELERPAEPTPPAVSELQIGCSMSDKPHPGDKHTARCYHDRDSDIPDAVNKHHAKRLNLSLRDDPTDPNVVVSRIKAIFTRFPSLEEIDYFHNNEADRSDHRGGSLAEMTAWANEHAAIQAAIHAQWPDGRVKAGVDFIRDQIEKGPAGSSHQMLRLLQDRSSLPDVFGFSAYNQGRKANPPTYPKTGHPHIDVGVDMAAEFRIEWVSILEISMPLSPNYDRAAIAGQIPPHFRDYAISKGVKPRDIDYWDQTPNQYALDGSTATAPGKTQRAFETSLG